MTNFEKKISKRIYDFDFISLFNALEAKGYTLEDIRFESHDSISSQGSLIEAIRFEHEPVRQAVITVNLGLLSAQTPLPSYFLKKAGAEIDDSNEFIKFIQYFDHTLIKNYVLNCYPEINKKFFSDWEKTKQLYVRMLDLKSSATLYWLFQLLFPELTIRVEKAALQRTIQSAAIRLGKTVLGSDAVFGKKTKISVYGRRITLFSESEISEQKIPWPKEVKARLKELLFPILRFARMDMEIFLVIRSQKRWAKLESESYLGYDKIKGGKASYRRIKIFKGRLQKF